jgi:hypothetical protein
MLSLENLRQIPFTLSLSKGFDRHNPNGWAAHAVSKEN